jgi:GNAT superfamily N-acetyltransferase
LAVVRMATEPDVPRILELYEELTEERHHLSPDYLQRVFAEILSMPGHELLIADEDGVVIGTLVLLVVPNLSHGALPWAIIENMVVDSRYRRRGIGRLLMEYAINQARQSGCYKVQLLSNVKRHEAHQFYRSLGFETSAHGFRLYL